MTQQHSTDESPDATHSRRRFLAITGAGLAATANDRQIGFQARPVAGGHFALLTV